MVEKPIISVVIPAYNAAHTIEKCLAALGQQTFPHPFEIIVVDNGSQDDTASRARNAGVQLITVTKKGAAAARNAGIHAASAPLICFTDADCAPFPDWLENLSAPFTNPDIIGAKGIYATHQKQLVARFVQLEYEDKYDLLRTQERIDFIDTYSAAYRREVLLANQGFEERIFYVEDQELSFRLAARGYEMVFQPKAIVYHYHSDTLWHYARKKFMIAYWKAQVVRRFPTQGVRDSHTPQIMKVQMVLITLAAATTPLLLTTTTATDAITPLLALIPLTFLATFALTTIPFLRKAWPKDPAVALASPALLALRAFALSLGYAIGLIRPQPGISGTESTIGGFNYVAKRTIDIITALLGLTSLTLIGPLLALAIKLDSPGPVLFRQERVGQKGKPFIIYKFRSMHPNAEQQLEQLIDLNNLDQPAFKIKNDPRVTRVGRFMRRWSLDEMPQFWNILKGDMSLIGPRPEESRIVAAYTDWHRRRLAVKPGLTGPMQVNGRGDLPLDERVHLELDYIENYTIIRDLKIILQTIPAILTGKGAH
ncbi:MAG TPA: sugar transferase [Anaerolineae bacterium]|nr:sugar transferase [Anaerolineae bacterium]